MTSETPGKPLSSSKPCACLACQAGLALTCKATEARIREDERRFIARELRAWSRDLVWHVDNKQVTRRLTQLLADAADHIEGAA